MEEKEKVEEEREWRKRRYLDAFSGGLWVT